MEEALRRAIARRARGQHRARRTTAPPSQHAPDWQITVSAAAQFRRRTVREIDRHAIPHRQRSQRLRRQMTENLPHGKRSGSRRPNDEEVRVVEGAEIAVDHGCLRILAQAHCSHHVPGALTQMICRGRTQASNYRGGDAGSGAGAVVRTLVRSGRLTGPNAAQSASVVLHSRDFFVHGRRIRRAIDRRWYGGCAWIRLRVTRGGGMTHDPAGTHDGGHNPGEHHATCRGSNARLAADDPEAGIAIETAIRRMERMRARFHQRAARATYIRTTAV